MGSEHNEVGVVRKSKVTELRKKTTEQLFDGASEILIEHLGESYMLSITKQKKLLLTKVKHHF